MQFYMMNKTLSIMRIIFVFCFLINSLSSLAQESSPNVIIDKLKSNYKDFVIIDDNIYVITKGDSLIVWNFINDSYKVLIKNTNTITKNSDNELLITTSDSLLLVKKDDWEKLKTFHGKALGVFLDKDNEPVVISDKGIFYENGIYPKEPCKIFRGTKRNGDLTTLFLRKPDIMFLDTKHRIWLTYDNGEWGPEIWIFDLEKKLLLEEEYLSIDVDYNKFKNRSRYETDLINTFSEKIKLTKKDTLYKFPANLPVFYGVKGIAENKNGTVFISQSLHHFNVNGCIYSYSESDFKDFYTSKEVSVLDYENEFEDEFGNINKLNTSFLTEYVGSIAYNKFDDSIYYYSNKGFFKIIEIDSNYTKEPIINPSLTWKSGLSNSVGYQMAVKKFEFIDAERFVFLTNLNGIGYYDGKQVKYYY